ncbi:carbon monoxide dehydrogenase [Sulfolobus sp. A20]|uniref:SRPBCC family protein n=1 Tax=Sulfolobaceae TaxID=118883 RepID=UPI000845C5C4|nr:MULTISPECIES: carbon monoxide dehydrogenase subunit G [unclassified Sulfolobus]TRM75156.1 carbon monoxide dehydrogenase [Sulfolobus sp. E5]TRM76809.1 carbon monoxide dehydrogenase [Sulfolobus sp. A20-N-F8]TRM77832.1 carbon monoxide dehydrogenase [Sulfolobus sp. B5]TRM83687.1 carbon monoxide dehydrogenase [Sulfolobus sp. A20-N-F6]TRM84608.1 carbon monoxide dehydrogenase [Sulfolobus sp. F3]TRM88273.1 carbon monoxide dehydrogenase [Sulfolobus sp. C3]TRM95262.1 carbon monoxide dehydrogenase [
MEISGEFVVNKVKAKISEFLTEPKMFTECLPGLQGYEIKRDGEIGATFKIDVSDFNIPHMSTITANINAKIIKDSEKIEIVGNGRSAGVSIKINISLNLYETQNSTKVIWSAKMDLGLLAKLLGENSIRRLAESNVNYIINCIHSRLS